MEVGATSIFAVKRVLYRLCIAVLALAVSLGGLVPFFGDASARAATGIPSHHQHTQTAGNLAMPMHAVAHHHHAGMPHDDGIGSPSPKHPASHDHGCQACCALCSATTVSAPVLPEATLTLAGHQFMIRTAHLLAVQVLLDPGIPKTPV
jgi:hypothetical protein